MTDDLATIWASFQMQVAANRPRYVTVPTSGCARTIPVVLLTGFLGAGKSHLLAHLLSTAPEGLVVKAVVNDVGTLPFDPTLVASSGDVRIELTNGCACCERVDDLAATFDELVTGPDCDLIVLEASGAADPSSLAQVVWANPALDLDRIVTVIDAHQLLSRDVSPAFSGLMARQIDAAHAVVLTRCDELDDDAIDAARSAAVDLAPGRTITQSSLDAPGSQVLLPQAPRGAGPRPTGPQISHEDLFVKTIVPRQEPTVDRLSHMLESARPELVRAKGRVRASGRTHIVQVTPTSIDIVKADDGDGEIGLTIIATSEGAVERLTDRLGDDTD